VAGVEHPDLVSMFPQDRRESLDSQGRKPHDLDPLVARLGAPKIFGQQPVEILVIYVNEKHFHNSIACDSLLNWQRIHCNPKPATQRA
jgi:hypothetical protein